MSSSISTQLSSLVVRRPETLVGLLRGRAIRHRERVAYTFLLDGEAEEKKLTYGELDEQARAVAAMLQAAGAVGKRVLLLYPSGLEYVSAFFGCLYAGAVAVPAYPPRLNRSLLRLQAVVDDAQATLALTTKEILGRVTPMLAEATGLQALCWLDTDELDRRIADEWREPSINGSTLAFLQYTSGSTSTPKGVMVTHDNLLHNEEMISNAFKQTSDSVIAGWLPLYHDMGLIGNVLQPLYLNARCILMSPTAFLQRPVRWLQAISRYRATTSGGPNFAYELCVNKVTEEQRASLDLSGWSVAFNGAEPVRSETLERFAETFAACGFRREAFQPCYGLAEATLIVSGGLESGQQTVKTVQAKALESDLIVEAGAGDAGTRSLVGCGRALLDQEIVIVHPESLGRCALEEVGEIWVKGPSIAAGYWGRSEETERTFRARISDSGEGPFLRTGDLGALIGGELFVTGRLKDLLIIRGRNHYPQDIELSAERSHPALRRGCGAAFSIAVDGEEVLVIVYELDHRQHAAPQDVIDNVRQAVSEEHEVQVGAVVLIRAGTLPKTSSGKIQRSACRAAFLASELSSVAEWRQEAGAESETAAPPVVTRPQGLEEIQNWLVSHLAASLRIDPSGINAFQPVTRYGLDSLVAIELVHSIENKLGVTLPMASLLQSSSIAELAAQALAQLSAGPAQPEPAVALASEFGNEHPLSYGQRALWFLHQLAPESAAYNLSFGARVRSTLDVAVLRRSMQVLVDRHPSLRTTFEANQGEPIQHVHARVELSFREEDAALWNETELQERMAEESRRPFNLERGPLLRVVVFKRPAQEHLILMTAHHVVADSWSLGVLAHELGLVYESERNGVRAPLAPLPLQHGDYARREADALAGFEGKRLRAYWQKQLGGDLPLLDLPTDRQRPALQTYRGTSHHFTLDGGLSQALKKLGLASDATLYMILLAAFQALLHRYTGQQDILVGSPTTGRNRSDLAGLIGYFVNPLVMRADFSARPTFAELLQQMRQTVLGAFEHQDYPFPLLVEQLQPERDPSRSPLFQAMFILHKAHLLEHDTLTSFALAHGGVETRLGGLRVESVPLRNEIAQFDVTLMLAEEGGSLAASLEYNTDLFDETTIARMAGHYRMLLESIVIDPRCLVSALPILTEPERRQLLVDWNRTEAEYASSQTINQLFEAQAQKTPGADALVCGHERLSYRELNRRANRLAHHLRRLGVGPEVRVGVCVERTADLLVALLGVLKAGGAYIPLDPSYPKGRLAFMLEDGQATVLLTQSHLLARLPEHGRRVICLDETRDDLPHEIVENLTPTATPDNLAYVIYTSGSTGIPKGVAIGHRSALALIDWSRGVFTAEDLAGTLASTSICFDLSIFELFLPLACGHKIILADNALCLADLPAAAEVTLINTVPSAMTELLRVQEIPASVKVVNLAGEPLPNHLVQQIYQRGAVEKVFNLYGPSEDTTYSTFALIEEGSHEAPSIGRPISNTEAYVLDGHLEPVPIGVAGELYVGGAGLARGYLKRPQLTAERFIPHPFSS
ncbi:MAG: hypothetical protein QOG23_5745, partial [Blastocatellia bacterium]|nr:hypothetical protein [Blastocatellia bacterium]